MSKFGIDVLAVAPHPDDAEIFCGGTLLMMKLRGHKTGIVDLARGEMASRGSVETRVKETEVANKILKLDLRENLGLPDGSIGFGSDVEEQLRLAVKCLRTIRPELLLLPSSQCRHPDHWSSHELMRRATFMAGLEKFAPDCGPRYVPHQVLYCQFRYEFRPSLIVDVSAVHADKLKAIEAYNTQIRPVDEKGLQPEAKTLLSNRHSVSSIEARDRYHGAMIGVAHGEAFLAHNVIGIKDPLMHFRENPGVDTLIYPAVKE